jgi:hypothetical protein
MSNGNLQQPTFENWKREVDDLMHRQYAITIVDAGIDDDGLRKHWGTQSSAGDFVEWFAIKYDLTSVAEWNLSLRARR